MTTQLSTFKAIWLIAKREIGMIMRAKSTIISTVIIAVLIIGGLTAFKFFADRNEVSVGYVDQQIEATYFSGFLTALDDAGVEPVIETYPSLEALNTAVEEGEVDGGLIEDEQGLKVVAHENPDSAIYDAATKAQQGKSILDLSEALPGGVNDPLFKNLTEPVRVDVLNPPTEVEGSQAAVGFIVGLLLYLGIFGGGMSVAQGVVEEKSSRVVEILLASVRPWQLLTGKVLGIGIASLAQVAVYVGAGVITARVLGLATELPFDIMAVGGWVLLWFLIGYIVYALIFAGLGALVSRQEDLGSVIMLPMILIIFAYMLGVTVAPNDPDSTLVAVASYIPFTSPIVMPIRSAYGVAGTGEVWIAALIGLITIPLLLALTAKIYGNGVRRSGAKIKLRDALKQS